MGIGKRGLLLIILIILLSSIVSAGLFSGVWQDYFTGRQVKAQAGVKIQSGLIYSIGPSVPIYSVPFNIVVVTNRPAICQYTFSSKDYQNLNYVDFTNNGGTDHIQNIPGLYDGDILLKARCKDFGLFKPWEYTQTNFIVSTKGGCCIVGNNCNTYKTPGECTNLGGALYPDPGCKYTNCQVAIADIKKPDLIIENVEESREIREKRGEELVAYKYKIFIKNIGNAPVNENFYVCGKVEGLDYCTKGTMVEQKTKEFVYESGDNFISNLVRRVLNVVSVKEILDPIGLGEVKEINVGTSNEVNSFIVDTYIGKGGATGSEKMCIREESVPLRCVQWSEGTTKKLVGGVLVTIPEEKRCIREEPIRQPMCLEWRGGENYHNLIDELDESNNEYVLS